MPGAAADEHRQRAQRAQQLSDRACEEAGAERAAAERSERLIDGQTAPELAKLHRQSAAVHRQAQQHQVPSPSSASVRW